MTKPPLNPLEAPVSSLRGVRAERVTQLARLKIRTVGDLLLHRPRRHEDRRQFRPIAELRLGEPAIARGTVVALGVKRWRRGTRSVFELILEDGTARLHCRWWNLPFMEKYFHQGDEVLVFGKPTCLKPRTLDHPETEVLEAGEENFIHLNRIVPVYPLTEGLPQRWLRSLIWRTLQEHEADILEPWPLSPVPSEGERVPEGRAREVRGQGIEKPTGVMRSAPTRAKAVRMIHFPDALSEVEIARQRLALDEFVELQIEIQGRRWRLQTKARAVPCRGDNRLIRPFLKELGFTLTDGQSRVLREIRHDLGGAQPMRRLLQGDVGAGKTVVAACSALMALESGCNAALMAPTEILADQHFQTFARWFAPLGVEVRLRTGNSKVGGRDARITPAHELPLTRPLATLSPQPEGRGQGEGGPGRFRGAMHGANAVEAHPLTAEPHPASATLTIGTHALITAGFDLPNLGLVIIDEQHKFGVAQREKLVRKGNYPHLLVMTATPIPRTLGLTLYGDLDISVIDQLPPGRGRIKTFVRTADKLPRVWEFIRGKLKQGRQVYVVYPRVEGSDLDDLKAVNREWEKLRADLAPWQVGLLHGRLNSEEKEAVMNAFRGNQVQVLVATSVIEVGVDVPNATVMLIENAEQFGLAQLHQLRGRIGRAAHESYCILVADIKSTEAKQRLKVLEETSDGFRIAEADLRLRGPGELLGREQSGLPSFRFGNLELDGALVEYARVLAREMVWSHSD